MSNSLTITYVPSLASHVAIQDGHVVGANTNYEALVAEVGEPTPTAESVFTEHPDGPSVDVTELLGGDIGAEDAVYLDHKYRTQTGL